MFDFISISTTGIHLTKFYSEEYECDVYTPTLILCIDDETDEGFFINIETEIYNQEKLAACYSAAQVLHAITGDEIIATVDVFDENGDVIETFNLNDETAKSEMKGKRVLH